VAEIGPEGPRDTGAHHAQAPEQQGNVGKQVEEDGRTRREILQRADDDRFVTFFLHPGDVKK
jgi:hypothetical protein